MKHLLIILISLLLLSSPVIGQETGVLYQWESSYGYVWKTFGDEETNGKYRGEIKNGKPHGFGICNWIGGLKYVGEWKEGKLHGKGTMTYGNNHQLGPLQTNKGIWKNDKKWNTKLVDNIKFKIIGKWVNGKFIKQ